MDDGGACGRVESDPGTLRATFAADAEGVTESVVACAGPGGLRASGVCVAVTVTQMGFDFLLVFVFLADLVSHQMSLHLFSALQYVSPQVMEIDSDLFSLL